MFLIDQQDLAERFMRYVRVDTQSDPNSKEYPTTEKQKDLARILFSELEAMGIRAETDDYGYVYAWIPATTTKTDIPAIAFCAHMDTAPDCSGTGVKPILHQDYNGTDIVLPDDSSQVISPLSSPYLKQCLGHDIISASGNTLLGSDDKSGVAIIMQAAQYLVSHPEIPHGPVMLLFTPDEEVGKGTAHVDLKKLGAEFGYTLDGGVAGSLEDETFSADGATITLQGVIVHPGYAKGKLQNALKIAGAVLEALPKTNWSPETTEGMEGFVHPVSMQGIAEKTSISFLIRDFRTDMLDQHHARLENLVHDVVALYPGCTYQYEKTEQYRNMKDVLNHYPFASEFAKEAIQRTGLAVIMESIRGGTDGSRLSYMGLPCPNLFTGMQNIHSKTEWVSVQDMAKAAETILHLVMVWEEKGQGKKQQTSLSI